MSHFKVDVKKILTLIPLVFLTALVISGATWFFSSLSEENISQTRDVEISGLQDQLLQLREAARAKEAFETSNRTLGANISSRN